MIVKRLSIKNVLRTSKSNPGKVATQSAFAYSKPTMETPEKY